MRVFHKSCNVAVTGIRDTVKNVSFSRRAVGKPVSRHAAVYRTLAGETRSDARMASEGPALR